MRFHWETYGVFFVETKKKTEEEVRYVLRLATQQTLRHARVWPNKPIDLGAWMLKCVWEFVALHNWVGDYVCTMHDDAVADVRKRTARPNRECLAWMSKFVWDISRNMIDITWLEHKTRFGLSVLVICGNAIVKWFKWAAYRNRCTLTMCFDVFRIINVF